MKLALSSVDWDVTKEYESVELIGVSGIRVDALAAYLHHARRTRPTVVVLDVGTNDLCSAYCQGTTVAAKVYAIACQYADIPSVRHLILGEVIRRGDGKAKFETERERGADRRQRHASERIGGVSSSRALDWCWTRALMIYVLPIAMALRWQRDGLVLVPVCRTTERLACNLRRSTCCLNVNTLSLQSNQKSLASYKSPQFC